MLRFPGNKYIEKKAIHQVSYSPIPNVNNKIGKPLMVCMIYGPGVNFEATSPWAERAMDLLCREGMVSEDWRTVDVWDNGTMGVNSDDE